MKQEKKSIFACPEIRTMKYLTIIEEYLIYIYIYHFYIYIYIRNVDELLYQTGKTTTIRRIAVREAGVSLPIETQPEALP